jgi:hypothetical protein
MPRTRKEAPPSKVSSPSMMQTMRMVNQILSMPQQPNESTSAANAQHRVIKHSRKPATTIADNTIDLRTNLIVHTPSGSGKIFPTSQVAKQHYQNNTIKNGYTTNIPDQGISINVSGQPYDCQPDHLEGGLPPPHQSGGVAGGGYGPNPPGGSDSDPSYQETGSGEEDEEETSSSDEEEDVKELFTALVTPESRATARLSA